MDIEGGDRLSEINTVMNKRKVCQHPFLFGEPKDKITGEFVGIKNPEVGSVGFLKDRCLSLRVGVICLDFGAGGEIVTLKVYLFHPRTKKGTQKGGSLGP